jgi:UDP-3-O-[3-hydroxymyristoyl] glucosamine N-acyltransferase
MSQPSRQYPLSDLSARFELELRGDGEHRIGGVGTLADAGSGDITFLANPGYRKQLGSTTAGPVILKEKDAADCPTNCLVTADPYLAYARIATLFDPRPAARPGIHPTAVIGETVRLGRDVSIGAHAVIAEGCIIGDGCAIGPGCVIEADCTLGAGCRLYANVSIGYAVRIGERVIIHPGAVIGADGFGIAFAGDHWEKVPQVGSVVIGNDCEIGANSCIDRGALGDTVLEDDCRLDNLVQIGHNVFVGAHTAIAAMGGAAGSARIGRFCLLGGQAAVTGHQELADRTTLAATSKVMKTVREPGLTLSGLIPAQPIREWQRSLARLRRLDALLRRVKNLEKQLGNQSNDDQ